MYALGLLFKIYNDFLFTLKKILSSERSFGFHKVRNAQKRLFDENQL